MQHITHSVLYCYLTWHLTIIQRFTLRSSSFHFAKVGIISVNITKCLEILLYSSLVLCTFYILTNIIFFAFWLLQAEIINVHLPLNVRC